MSTPRRVTDVGVWWLIMGLVVGSIFLNIQIAEAYKVEEPVVIAEVLKKEVRIEIVYSKESIEREIRKAFPENPDLAVAIAKAESGENLNTKAYNPESHGKCNGSYGVFQIACVHEKNTKELYDPMVNIKKARAIYLKEGWKPWGGYTSKGYKKFL